MARVRSKAKRLTQAEIVSVLRATAQRWVNLPYVTSVGVGYKKLERQDKVTDQLSIQVTVTKKLSPAELKREGLEPLPKSVRTDDGVEVPVDVVQRNFKLDYQVIPPPAGSAFNLNMPADPALARRIRLDQVMPGISISHVEGRAGTLGSIVYDNQTGLPCVLSNAHVLEGPTGQIGDEVLQPGLSDDPDLANNLLGQLLRSHVGLAGDCAIASLDKRLFVEPILELNVAPRRCAKVEVGDLVIKSGRTTGVTQGVVSRAGVVFSHDYGPLMGVRQIGGFEIEIDPANSPRNGNLSDGGDSGCLWLIVDNGIASDIAAGLHFASQDDPMTGVEFALACNIHSVLEMLDVSFAPKV